MRDFEIGKTYELKEEVTYEKTAEYLGSGGVKVLATPYLIMLMEKASMINVSPFLDEYENTVGTLVNIEHCKASKIGATVTIVSKLTEVDRRRLVFDVQAFDEDGKIGFGKHERFVIETEKFIKKVYN